jgi:hypothetical protein
VWQKMPAFYFLRAQNVSENILFSVGYYDLSDGCKASDGHYYEISSCSLANANACPLITNPSLICYSNGILCQDVKLNS